MTVPEGPVDSDSIRRPAVSVIVTNYNYERYVVECLQSLVAQTVAPIECIVVDDASTDDSVARIQNFIDSHKEIPLHLVPLPENKGQMNAFVEGFHQSSGDFIVFVDADDYLFPDFIETHLAAHLNTEYLAALTSSNEVLVDGSGRLLAGSIEKARRGEKAGQSHLKDVRADATTISEWRDTWDFGNPVAFRQEPRPLLYVAAKDNANREFLWSTTSGTMFRRGALEFVLTDRARTVSISADFYLFHYSHLLGGSTLVQTSHGFYRRHGVNQFSTGSVVGRGTRSWSGPQRWSRQELFRKLEDDILADVDRLRQLLGTPRMLQVLSLVIPLRRIGDISAVLGAVDVAKYFALLAVVSSKKLLRGLRQLWDFA